MLKNQQKLLNYVTGMVRRSARVPWTFWGYIVCLIGTEATVYPLFVFGAESMRFCNAVMALLCSSPDLKKTLWRITEITKISQLDVSEEPLPWPKAGDSGRVYYVNYFRQYYQWIQRVKVYIKSEKNYSRSAYVRFC